MDVMIHTKSFRKGIQSIEKPLHFFKPEYWSFDLYKITTPWLHAWTPSWHKGRGPYITFGFLFFRIIRGY